MEKGRLVWTSQEVQSGNLENKGVEKIQAEGKVEEPRSAEESVKMPKITWRKAWRFTPSQLVHYMDSALFSSTWATYQPIPSSNHEQ